MTPEEKRGPGRPKDEGLAERRREEILAVATEVFAENGIRATDVQEIADRVGVGKGTVYRYFPGKDDLFLATVERVMDRLTDQIRIVFGGEADPRVRLERLIERFFEFFDEEPSFVEVLVIERAEFRARGRLTFFEYRDALQEEFRALDDSLHEAGILRYAKDDPEHDVVGELMYGVLFTNRYSGDALEPAERRRVLIDILLNGSLLK